MWDNSKALSRSAADNTTSCQIIAQAPGIVDDRSAAFKLPGYRPPQQSYRKATTSSLPLLLVRLRHELRKLLLNWVPARGTFAVVCWPERTMALAGIQRAAFGRRELERPI